MRPVNPPAALDKEREGGRVVRVAIPTSKGWRYFNQPISATDRNGKNFSIRGVLMIVRKVLKNLLRRKIVFHAERWNLIKTKGPPSAFS